MPLINQIYLVGSIIIMIVLPILLNKRIRPSKEFEGADKYFAIWLIGASTITVASFWPILLFVGGGGLLIGYLPILIIKLFRGKND